MKTNSKALRDYLIGVNAIHGTPEEISRARLDYRKQYKRNWKRQKAPRKELRIEVSVRQHQLITDRASERGLPPTAYARDAILASVSEAPPLSIDAVQEVLQAVSMAANAVSRCPNLGGAHKTLLKAEACLLTYLKHTEP